VKLSDRRVKSAHVLKVGDAVSVRVGELEWQIRVKALSDKRGPAVQARQLYEETEASRIERERRMALRRWSAEPSAEMRGRPTKRDRRRLEDVTSPPDES
jgi:ribosome-associated heat shock protein Hsp15